MTDEEKAAAAKQEQEAAQAKTKELADAKEKERLAQAERDRVAQVEKDRLAQAEADAKLESERPGAVVVDTKAPEAVAKQHEQVDADLAKRSEGNEEGHAKNMDRLENEANEAQARTAHADDPRARHTPTGKEVNRNTPRIDKDGNKHWD